MNLLIYISVLTSVDDKGDNDILGERDDDLLFDLFFDGLRERDLVLWPRLTFFEASVVASTSAVLPPPPSLLAFDEFSAFNKGLSFIMVKPGTTQESAAAISDDFLGGDTLVFFTPKSEVFSNIIAGFLGFSERPRGGGGGSFRGLIPSKGTSSISGQKI